MDSRAQQHTRTTIVRLLSNMGSSREIRQYLERFSDVDADRFAVIKIGGALIEDELEQLASSLSFLHRVGLVPVVIHGAGPQLNQALAEAGVESHKVDGLRVTTPEVLAVARKVFAEQNLKLVDALNRLGTAARSIIGGVFQSSQIDADKYQLVGEVEAVDPQLIEASLAAQAIPVIASIGETRDGQILNVNADTAATALVEHFQPYKVVFLTDTGGILDQHNEVISSINLCSDFEPMMQAEWLHSGMRLKLSEIAELLNRLPASSSVSITRPAQLPRELFTHQGSGTLIRRGEPIEVHQGWDSVDLDRLRALLESSFGKKLHSDYFERTALHRAYISESYRSAAIITLEDGLPHLDKFAVEDTARGEGLGRAVWMQMRADFPQLFWRCKSDNPVNAFYVDQADGCAKGHPWTVYWCGIEDWQQIARCVEHCRARPASIGDPA
jgi:acetylglutamate kinase